MWEFSSGLGPAALGRMLSVQHGCDRPRGGTERGPGSAESVVSGSLPGLCPDWVRVDLMNQLC